MERHKRAKAAVRPGPKCRGFIVTATNPAKWRDALNELEVFLNKVHDFSGGEKTEESNNFDEELANELASLKHANTFNTSEIVRGCGFLKLPDGVNVSPSILLKQVCEAIEAKPNDFKVRHVQRVIPLDVTSDNNLDALKRAVISYLPSRFRSEKENTKHPNLEAKDPMDGIHCAKVNESDSWKIQFNRRNNGGGEKKAMIDYTVEACVGHLQDAREADKTIFPIDLDHGKFTVFVEINPVLSGVGICEGYSQYLKFNLMEIWRKHNDKAKSNNAKTERDDEKAR